MSQIHVYPLGAGQDVGRSCIIIKIFEKTIMLDTGLHMGKQDNKEKYPDFEKLKEQYEQKNGPNYKNPNEPYNDIIDLVLVSHFHLDHVGALPYFTEIHGYSNPIYMTTPSKALLPYMLEDCRKVLQEQNKDKEYHLNQIKVYGSKEEKKQMETQEQEKKQNFSIYDRVCDQNDLKKCLAKVKTLQLHETVNVDGLKIKAYYAGHVLGACMFLIEYKGSSVLYTGDYNSNADRHLGAAYIDKVFPDVLITETTYATTIRDSKRARERDFLQQVQETIDKGGKVLIPVFALGRAQELSILLETYWNRINNKVPIYFSAGLIAKANFYYKLFVNWTNENIKSNYLSQNMFDFKNITIFDKSQMRANTPMVLFATPGMLHGGTSVTVFKEWCSDPKNTLIIPGYCVPGTLGNKLLSGQRNIQMDGKELDIQMQIKNMSFSAHADAKGILGLIRHCEPKNVVFVHGEKGKMEILKKTVEQEFKIPVFMPANFQNDEIQINKGPLQTLEVNSELPKQIQIAGNISKKQIKNSNNNQEQIYTFKETNIANQNYNKCNLQTGFIVNLTQQFINSFQNNTENIINYLNNKINTSLHQQLNINQNQFQIKCYQQRFILVDCQNKQIGQIVKNIIQNDILSYK